MKKVLEGELPSGYKTGFEIALFNSKQHRDMQSPDGWQSFHLVHVEKKLALASVHFHVSGSNAFSPFKAPFGSFEWSDYILPSELYDFISSCESLLRAKGVRSIELKHPPLYRPKDHLLAVFLLNQEYSASGAEVGAFIKIDADKFEDKLDSWPKRKKRQTRDLKLSFREISHDRIAEVYDFISDARKERGYSISMNKTDLLQTVKNCNKNFFLFGIFNGKDLIAAAISIRVSDDVLYNFYLAHSKETDKLSPVVTLLEGIYDWCQEHKITWLDLGTSALDETPNFPLLEFKMRVGAIPVSKLTFMKHLQ